MGTPGGDATASTGNGAGCFGDGLGAFVGVCFGAMWLVGVGKSLKHDQQCR